MARRVYEALDDPGLSESEKAERRPMAYATFKKKWVNATSAGRGKTEHVSKFNGEERKWLLKCLYAYELQFEQEIKEIRAKYIF